MVLKLISEDKTYGYELIAKIDRESQGLFKMKEGTLYPILYKLEDEGLIQSEWQNPEGKQKAKMFDLTILGVLLLALAVYHGIPLAAPWLAAKYVLSGMNAQENTQIFMAFRLGARETIIKLGIELTAGLLMLLWAIRRKKKRP